MSQNGSMGKWMMRNTASVQINFDFTSERELNEMVFIADCLNPVCAFLFSNSPFKGGKRAKKDNLRNIIWGKTDSRRCKNLIDHGIRDSSHLLDSYIDYILNIDKICFKRINSFFNNIYHFENIESQAKKYLL